LEAIAALVTPPKPKSQHAKPNGRPSVLDPFCNLMEVHLSAGAWCQNPCPDVPLGPWLPASFPQLAQAWMPTLTTEDDCQWACMHLHLHPIKGHRCVHHPSKTQEPTRQAKQPTFVLDPLCGLI